MKTVTTLLTIIVFTGIAFAKDLRTEQDYVDAWCNNVGGQIEFRLPDDTRVDCLRENYAIEFDFAYKPYECIGQAMYYSLETENEGICVLIKKHGMTDFAFNRYSRRAHIIAKKGGVSVTCIDENAKEFICPFSDTK